MMKPATLLASLGLALVAAPASAAWHTVGPAQVEKIVTHESAHNGTNWFTLVGVSSVGACAQHQGKVAFAVGDDERGRAQLAALNAALLSGRNVVIVLDDALTSNGLCRAKAVELRR